MNKITHRFLLVLAGALLPAAITLHAAGVGTTGANFLKVGVGSRALGMGGTAVTSVDDANAIYWNPARLTTLKSKSMTASYNTLFEDQSQGFVGGAMPLPENKGSVGLGINYLQVTDIDEGHGELLAQRLAPSAVVLLAFK